MTATCVTKIMVNAKDLNKYGNQSATRLVTEQQNLSINTVYKIDLLVPNFMATSVHKLMTKLKKSPSSTVQPQFFFQCEQACR